MTKEDMLKEIRAGVAVNRKRWSANLIESLFQFYDEFDPYGMREEYGDLTVKSHIARAKRDIRYLLNNTPEVTISDLEEM